MHSYTVQKSLEPATEVRSESHRYIRLDASVQQENGRLLRVSAEHVQASVVTDRFSGLPEVSPVYAQPKVKAVDSSGGPTAAASNILGFIEQRLGLDAAEGADQEALQSRLEAGLEGFIKGFSEAREQLAALNQLNGDVLTAVDQTYKDVLNGVADLAEEYGLNNPAEAYLKDVESGEEPLEVGAVEQLVNADSVSLTAGQVQSRTFEFELTTAEGDVVLIRALAEQVHTLNYQKEGDSRSIVSEGVQASRFLFEVNGELNEEETAAINDLLGQVTSLTNTFYDGNVEGAFQEALNLGYDDEQIASFSLNLSMSTYTRVENTYGDVANSSLEDQPQEGVQPAIGQTESKVAQMAVFIQQLEQMRLESNEMGIERRSLVSLFDLSAHEDGSAVGRFAERFLQALEGLQQTDRTS